MNPIALTADVSKPTPWSTVGLLTFLRTYSRRIIAGDADSPTETWDETIERVIRATDTQLNVGFTDDEKDRLRGYMHDLKGTVAGRFLWQLGTTTVSKLGLPSLQNCAACVVDQPIRPFTWIFDRLMLGVGVGVGIQKEYVYKLPPVREDFVPPVRVDTADADFIVPDTREGWVSLLEKILKSAFYPGEKTGFSFSTQLIRGKGAPIKGFGGVSSGPEELCVGLSEIARVIEERAGKQLRPIDCLDIVTITGQIVISGNIRRSAIIAIGDSDDLQFLNAKNWSEGNIPNWRANSNNSVVCNDIKNLPEEFWNGYRGNGEPYGLINMKLSRACGRIGETQYKDKDVVVYNPCVAARTDILTKDGYCHIISKLGQEVDVWNGFEWSTVTPEVTGKNQPMVTVTLSNGRSLRCTLGHRWIVATGRGASLKETKTQSFELKPGDRMLKSGYPVMVGGIPFADPYAPGTGFVPLTRDLKSRLIWLASYLDHNGTEVNGAVEAMSPDKNFLLNVQKMLTLCGAASEVTAEPHPKTTGLHRSTSVPLHRLVISASNVQGMKTLGLSCKNLPLEKPAKKTAETPVTVVSVIDSGMEETVYCFTEPKRNLGCFDGIVTANCGEQSLANYETCCLAETFLPNIESKEELFDLMCLLYRINKHSLTLPDTYSKETQAVVNKNMRMGLGVTGYLQATEEQRSWLGDTYVKLREYDIEYSKAHEFPISIKLTTVKPSGSLSLLPGVTSGVHPAYAQYMIRRIRIASNHPLVDVCRDHGYNVEFVRRFDGTDDHTTMVVEFPFSYPVGTVLAADMTAIDQLEYVRRLQAEWSDNSVSCTVYYKHEELPGIREYLKKHWNKNFKTLSFLLHDDHGFDQAPFEEITKEQFDALVASTRVITSVASAEIGLEDECAGGVCPVR